MSKDRKEPLYRKENKTTIRTKYYVKRSEHFRHQRNTKEQKNFEGDKQSMRPKDNLGRDYTPLYKFLLSKVGKPWDDVYSEAKSRLDKEEPIFYMVHLSSDQEPLFDIVWLGENSVYSKLFVDENGILQKVNPEAKAPEPRCSCCTLSFNGKPVNKNPLKK